MTEPTRTASQQSGSTPGQRPSRPPIVNGACQGCDAYVGHYCRTCAASECGRLMPKPALIGAWQWEADGCRCVLPPGHEGRCKCECYVKPETDEKGSQRPSAPASPTAENAASQQK